MTPARVPRKSRIADVETWLAQPHRRPPCARCHRLTLATDWCSSRYKGDTTPGACCGDTFATSAASVGTGSFRVELNRTNGDGRFGQQIHLQWLACPEPKSASEPPVAAMELYQDFLRATSRRYYITTGELAIYARLTGRPRPVVLRREGVKAKGREPRVAPKTATSG